jgi:hypothetical protein
MTVLHFEGQFLSMRGVLRDILFILKDDFVLDVCAQGHFLYGEDEFCL